MEKVVQGEKSSKDKFDKTGLSNWSISKFQKGRNQVFGRVSAPDGMPHPLQMFHGNHSSFDEGQARYQGHELGEKETVA